MYKLRFIFRNILMSIIVVSKVEPKKRRRKETKASDEHRCVYAARPPQHFAAVFCLCQHSTPNITSHHTTPHEVELPNVLFRCSFGRVRRRGQCIQTSPGASLASCRSLTFTDCHYRHVHAIKCGVCASVDFVFHNKRYPRDDPWLRAHRA